jgi:hypothetical protein
MLVMVTGFQDGLSPAPGQSRPVIHIFDHRQPSYSQPRVYGQGALGPQGVSSGPEAKIQALNYHA